MALPIFFQTLENTIDPANSNLAIIKPSSTNQASFGGPTFQHNILSDNAGGSVVVSNHIGSNSNRSYQTFSTVFPHMALIYNGHGGTVTPDYGQAILSTNEPFNFAGLATTMTSAQPSIWHEKFTTVSPPSRQSSAMAFQISSNKTILFGGSSNISNGQLLNDTWEWSGIQWQAQFPGASPSARFGHQLAYDAYSDKVVLYGGQDVNNNGFPETWQWDSNTWNEMISAGQPGGLYGHGLAFGLLEPGSGSQRYVTVLFGGRTKDTTLDGAINDSVVSITVTSAAGYPTKGLLIIDDEQITYTGISGGYTFTGCARGANGTVAASHADLTVVNGIFNNTWEWDGGTWTGKLTTHSPPARAYHAMAFDSSRNKVVMFGGNFDNTQFADIWEYDGTDWTQVFVTSELPKPRSSSVIVYDASKRYITLFGGSDGSITFNDTWTYDGISWAKLNILGPSARSLQTMAYDSLQNKIVLFGGLDQTISAIKGDTWQLNNPVMPLFVQTSGDGNVYYDATGIFPIIIGGVSRTLSNFVIITTILQHLFPSTSTLLSSGVDNIVTTIPVISTDGFPTDGTIFVDSEQISYSSITPNSFVGCTRSAPVLHSSGANVIIANQFILMPLVAPDDPNFSSGTKIGHVLDKYRIVYFENGNNTQSSKPLILKTTSSRIIPSLGDFLGPSSVSGTVTSTSDGYSPIFGCAISSPYIDPLTSNLYQTVIGSATVGLITLRIGPFFGFIPPASLSIDNFTPTSGIVGSTVIINGAGLLGTQQITFDGASQQTASYSIISSNQLLVIVPSDAQTGTITLTTEGGPVTSVQIFHALPIITNVSPNSAAIGTSITISGHTFDPITAIDFNGTSQMAFTIVNDTEITVTIPNGATSGPVHIFGSDGLAVYSNFNVVPPPVIDVSGIAPLSGPSDGYMSVTGSGFLVTGLNSDGYGVLDLIPVSTTLNGGINDIVTSITVASTAGFLSTGIIFIDSEQIFYSGTSPTSFTGCIRGYNTTSAASHLNGANVVTTPNGVITDITRTIFNDSQISVVVPTPSGTQPSAAYFVRVTTDGGVGLSPQSFSIIPKPTFLANNSFSPTSGAAGALVDIVGQYGFTGVSNVSFDGYTSPSVIFISDSHIQAVVPTAPGITTSIPISVTSTGGSKSSDSSTAAGGGPTSPATFKILQQPTISSFSPSSGSTGATISISGNNFLTADRAFFFKVADTTSTTGNVKRSVTTIAAGSDGYILPQATISVVDATLSPVFPSSGKVYVVTDSGLQKVSYTSISGGNTFAGCTGGVGKMHTGNAVYVVNVTTSSVHNFDDDDLILVDVAGNNGTSTDSNFPGLYINIVKLSSTSFCYPQAGTGITNASTIIFRDAQAQGILNIINNNNCTAIVPTSTTGIGQNGAGHITISAGTLLPLSSTSANSFTYLPSPNISSLNYTSGGWGSGGGSATQVVINGTNLLNSNSTAPVVLFGSTRATVLTFTPTQVTVNVPVGANNTIFLTTDGGTTSTSFTVVKPPVVNNSTPTSNCYNDSVSIFINGSGFQQTGQIGNPAVYFYHTIPNIVAPYNISNTQIAVNSNQLFSYFNTYSSGLSDVTFTIYVYVYYNNGFYIVTSPQTFTDLYCIG